MKKTNKLMDEHVENRFLPAEVLWNASKLRFQASKDDLKLSCDDELDPQELLSITIGVLRRQKGISVAQLSKKVGCTLEELLALESGILPLGRFSKFLPALLKEIDVSPKNIQSLLRNIRYV